MMKTCFIFPQWSEIDFIFLLNCSCPFWYQNFYQLPSLLTECPILSCFYCSHQILEIPKVINVDTLGCKHCNCWCFVCGVSIYLRHTSVSPVSLDQSWHQEIGDMVSGYWELHPIIHILSVLCKSDSFCGNRE